MKRISFFFLAVIFSSSICAQLSLTKMVGKYANRFKLGYCLFAFEDYPLNTEGNAKSIRIEWMDIAYFPAKDKYDSIAGGARAYISVKVGFKYIFSETRTGFYVEPSLGYARVAAVKKNEKATWGDGFAAAFETGYNLEVGQRGHELTFGLKYETDRAGSYHTISSVGLRLSYAFNLFRKKKEE